MAAKHGKPDDTCSHAFALDMENKAMGWHIPMNEEGDVEMTTDIMNPQDNDDFDDMHGVYEWLKRQAEPRFQASQVTPRLTEQAALPQTLPEAPDAGNWPDEWEIPTHYEPDPACVEPRR